MRFMLILNMETLNGIILYLVLVGKFLVNQFDVLFLLNRLLVMPHVFFLDPELCVWLDPQYLLVTSPFPPCPTSPPRFVANSR